MTKPSREIKAAPARVEDLLLQDRAAWAAWLAKHHQSSRGIWLILAKKGAGIPTPTYAEALEEALCFGWIDGQKAARDEKTWAQRFTPRGPRSLWSQINVKKAEALLAAARLEPAGIAAVEAAKRDGRWAAAYAPAKGATVPADLQAALDASPKASAFFATLSGANRYAILWRVETAKNPETRRERISRFVAMLERGETLHPQRR